MPLRNFRRCNPGMWCDNADMTASARPKGQGSVAQLVSTALRQDRLASLEEMLRKIAELIGGDICILWQAAPGAELEQTPPSGHLFVLAQWYRNEKTWTTHNLPLDSVTGNAVLTGETQHVQDARIDPRVNYKLPFFQITGTKTFFSIPIIFGDGMPGAVNVYRVRHSPFRDEELARGEELAALVPSLYGTIRDRVSLALVQKVDNILQSAETAFTKGVDGQGPAYAAVNTVCRSVQETLHALETSIFLEDRSRSEGVFEIAATTFEAFVTKPCYAAGDDGLTGWAVTHAKPIRIFDLVCFQEELISIRQRYPGVNWIDRNNVLNKKREYFTQEPGADIPPISFMAAPILRGGRVLGAIRCCISVRPPYYYAERELNLLELVATRISQFWENWRSRRDTEDENASWRMLVESVSKMNRFVQDEISRGSPDETKIFNEALRITSSVIRGAEIMDVRLRQEETNSLYFAAKWGALWNSGTVTDVKWKSSRLFPLGGEAPESVGAEVFRSGRLATLGNVSENPHYSKTFDQAQKMIVAPIQAQGGMLGVLDVRGTSPVPFPPHSVAIAELVAEQLGLYHYLAEAILGMRKAQAELSAHARTQRQTYADLGHQLKSPVVSAYTRTETALRFDLPEKVMAELLAVRSLLAKAKTVFWSTRLFAELEGNGELKPRLERLEYQRLSDLLSVVARDTELRVDPERQLSFGVADKTFRVLQATIVLVDLDLLEQAIANIMDNAGKYSIPRSKVLIHGGVTGGNRFHITVRNRGLKMTAEDVRQCVTRGWRGEEARLVTGEGSGLGLWIASHIMRSLGGELLILPTGKESVNEVKLLLPISERGRAI